MTRERDNTAYQNLSRLVANKLNQQFPWKLELLYITSCLRRGDVLPGMLDEEPRNWRNIDGLIGNKGLRNMRLTTLAPVGEEGSYVVFKGTEYDLQHYDIEQRIEAQYSGKMPTTIRSYAMKVFSGMSVDVEVEQDGIKSLVPTFIFEVDANGKMPMWTNPYARRAVRALKPAYGAIVDIELNPFPSDHELVPSRR